MRILTTIINQQMEPWYHLKLLMLNELHQFERDAADIMKRNIMWFFFYLIFITYTIYDAVFITVTAQYAVVYAE